jgi:hypothetical protein
VVPVPLHPRQGAAILDAGFAVLRTRPGLLLGVVASIVVPTSLLAMWMRGGPWGVDLATWFQAIADSFDSGWYEAQDASGDRPWAVAASFVVEAFATFVAGVAIGRILAAWYAGRPVSVRVALRSVGDRPGPTSVAFVISLLLIGIGAVACGIGAVIPAVGLMVVAPALAVEGLGGWAAVRRSFKLVNRRAGSALGVWLGAGLVAQLVRLALVFGTWVLTQQLVPVLADPLRWGAVVVTNVVLTLFSAGVAFFLYLDLRVRTEALDVELDATDAFG